MEGCTLSFLIEIVVYGLQLGTPEWLLRVGNMTGNLERVG